VLYKLYWCREVEEECGLVVEPADLDNFGLFTYEIKELLLPPRDEKRMF
jgi:hypothetical protein